MGLSILTERIAAVGGAEGGEMLLRRQVDDFMAVAEAGSLSSAARRLYTSQPTLSQEMSSFERELGVTLFRRSKVGVELTEAGASLYEDVCGVR